jgi:hypothetical protein
MSEDAQKSCWNLKKTDILDVNIKLQLTDNDTAIYTDTKERKKNGNWNKWNQ